METGQPTPEPEETDEDDTTTPKRKRSVSQLFESVFRRNEAAEQPEAAQEKRGSRLRRLANKLFGVDKLVEHEPVAPDHPPDLSAFLGRGTLLPIAEVDVIPPEHNEPEFSDTHETEVTDIEPAEVPVPPAETVELSVPITHETRADVLEEKIISGDDSEDTVETPVVAAHIVSPDATSPEAALPLDATLTPELPVSPEATGGGGGGGGIPIAERSLGPELAHAERVIERSGLAGAALLFVGAEHFGRKRADRKIRKEMNKSQNRQDKINKEGRTRLEQLARRGQDQLKEVDLREKRFKERVMERPITKEVPLRLKSERQIITPERKPEKIQAPLPPNNILQPASPDQIFEQSRNKVTPEQPVVSRETFVAKTPEAVKPKIQAEAPQPPEIIESAPIELMHERSHEIKDATPSFATSSSTKTPVRASAITQQATNIFGTAFEEPSPAPTTLLQNPKTPKEMYTKAAASGVGAALVILVFAALAYMVIH